MRIPAPQLGPWIAAACAAALCLSAAHGAAADELHVWGKQPVKGTVIYEDATMVKFKTESGEVLEVQRSMIRKLYTDAEVAEAESKTPDTEPETPDTAGAATKGPLTPTAQKPAGGWMMLLHSSGTVLGWRAVEMKRQGTGFVLEEKEFQLDGAGQPHFLSLATTTFGPEMQCLGSASRVLMKTRSRKGQDDLHRVRMGGGKIALATQDRGAAVTTQPALDVPKRTIFLGAELALLLHGKLAQELVDGKEIEPMHVPIPYALQTGGKSPDGGTIPLTRPIHFERIGVSEPNEAGFRTLAVKVRAETPEGAPPGQLKRYELAVADGKPVKLLTVETAGVKGAGGQSLPKQTHAPMRTVQDHDIFRMVPPAWRDLPMPIAPDPLPANEDK